MKAAVSMYADWCHHICRYWSTFFISGLLAIAGLDTRMPYFFKLSFKGILLSIHVLIAYIHTATH